MRLFIFLFILSFNTFATDWNELEVGKDYKLTQHFQLPLLERSSSLLNFSKNDTLVLQEIKPLDMIKVVVYEFDYKNCPGPEMTTDMEIIAVQETSPMVEIGAQLENCNLSIYIETKDIYTKAFIK